MTFEENMAKLNEMIRELEDDKLPLEDALDRYKTGIELSVECRKTLENAKLTVKTMSADKGDNNDD